MDRPKKAAAPRVKAGAARTKGAPRAAAANKPARSVKVTSAEARPVKRVAKSNASPAAPKVDAAEVVSEMRALEAELDKLIEYASQRSLPRLDDDSDPDLQAVSGEIDVSDSALAATPDAAPSLSTTSPLRPTPSTPRLGLEPRDGRFPSVPPAPESVFDTARELLTTDFYLRKWGRLAMRGRSEEVDDFGYDPAYDDKLRPLLDFLYATYFRVETSGVENVPAEGRAVLVANHSGTLPLDGLMIKTALKREHPSSRAVRWLTEDFIYHFPYLGSAMNRLGAVRACQENAARLLDQGELVAVFPEGVKGIGKLFSERYRLQRFGRGGFIKLCLRTRTPMVPVAVVGAEETNPMLGKIEHLAKLLGLPYVPVTPTFPLLGPVGLLPAPTKWQIHFGEPVDLSSYGPEAAEDELLVGKLAERVRASIQSVLDRAVSTRKSVFFG